MQTFFGSLGDKYGARRTFGYGLIGAGLSMVSFALENQSILFRIFLQITFGWWNDYRIFLLLLFLNGAFQVGEIFQRDIYGNFSSLYVGQQRIKVLVLG